MTGGEFALTRDDGRRLEGWASSGGASSAVFLHVGTPCAHVPFEPMVEQAVRRGCRFVTYSRPGYAGSTRQSGRSVVDCVDDVVAIADTLGLDRLYVVGWSGGGPHALACAARLSELVVSAATLAGVAPWRAAGLDWLDGMGEENREEFTAASNGTDALTTFLRPRAEEHATVTSEQVAAVLGTLVTDVDRAALTGAFAEYVAATFRRAFSTGLWGWHDDDLAFMRDWGFALDEITVPVTVWQGRQDAMVPYAHGEWLARRLPGARAMLFEDEGHLSLVARFGDVVENLLAAS